MPASSSTRPLQLRVRPDLQVHEQYFQGRKYWVVKDPIALRYYRFVEQEFAILQLLDGRISLAELQAIYQQRFAPEKISLGELQRSLAMFHRSSLTVADAAAQGAALLNRHCKTVRQRRLSALSNILTIRFPVYDPDRLLSLLDRRMGWVFSRVAFACNLVLMLAALLLVLVQFELFTSRLPAFHEFFAARNWFWLALTLAATKVLHEFGHGVACKRFGGECHEMGVMLLVLTPCLYCDVSDAWMLPSKWKRIAISAGGIYVELVLASICTLLWWFSEPGLLNYLCLNVIFVSSLSTVVFNANPLLRYDGYYILSDLAEIPNLRQKATAILQQKSAAWLLGVPPSADPLAPSRHVGWLAVYAIAAFAYRWFVVIGILLFLNRVFEPYGLQIIGRMLALAAIGGFLVPPARLAWSFLFVPRRRPKVKRLRTALSFAAAGGLMLFLLLIPLPHFVVCDFEISPRAASTVYIETAGTLEAVHVRAGDRVTEGAPLAKLSDIDLNLALLRFRAQQAQLEARRNELLEKANTDPAALREIPAVEDDIRAIADQITQRSDELSRLLVTAPTAGTVIATPVPRRRDDPAQLVGWSGDPLDRGNIGGYLTRGTTLCRVGDVKQIEAVLVIDQKQIEFVRPGLDVELLLDQIPRSTFAGSIEHLARTKMDHASPRLATKSSRRIESMPAEDGSFKPLHAMYEASVPLPNPDRRIYLGTTGTAKIHVGSRTTFARVSRYLSQTFR